MMVAACFLIQGALATIVSILDLSYDSGYKYQHSADFCILIFGLIGLCAAVAICVAASRNRTKEGE